VKIAVVGATGRSGGAPLVVPIETACFLDLYNVAFLGSLDRARLGAVHGERAVAAPAVVVLEVVGEQPAQLMLIEDDDVVEALAADTADHPLGERILPGAPRSS
jgi:hypothetical protein